MPKRPEFSDLAVTDAMIEALIRAPRGTVMATARRLGIGKDYADLLRSGHSKRALKIRDRIRREEDARG